MQANTCTSSMLSTSSSSFKSNSWLQFTLTVNYPPPPPTHTHTHNTHTHNSRSPTCSFLMFFSCSFIRRSFSSWLRLAAAIASRSRRSRSSSCCCLSRSFSAALSFCRSISRLCSSSSSLASCLHTEGTNHYTLLCPASKYTKVSKECHLLWQNTACSFFR